MSHDSVGIVGVGIMGGSYARHLIDAGFDIVAHDLNEDALRRVEALGGKRAATPAEVGERASVVLTSIPTTTALEAVILDKDGLAGSTGTFIVIELSTMPLALKERCRTALATTGKTVLDCPVSGTGAQAAVKDLIVFGSGDRAAYDKVLPILAGFSRKQQYLGEFGQGSKMKFLANVLVNIHNAAAAEVFALAGKAGVKLEDVYEVLKDSAGASRMFQVRGPLMVAQDYDNPTARISLHMKDLDVISEFAASLRCPLPLFSAATQLYVTALNEGRGGQDTAAVCAVVERMAGIER